MTYKYILIGLLVLTACTESQVKSYLTEQIKDSQVDYSGTVQDFKITRVVDGDTVEGEIEGVVEKIRLIGVDTPEVFGGEECYGKESSEYTRERLTGKTVYIESDNSQENRDKYDRLLRYIVINNGPNNASNFNRELIIQGIAIEYTYDKPYKFQDEFRSAQADAKTQQRGLWGACN